MVFVKNFAWLFGSKTSFIFASFFTGALINRALGPSGRGILAEIQTWVHLFMVIFGLSLDTAIYHFANRQRYKIDDSVRLTTILILNFILSALAMLSLFMFNMIYTQQFSREASALLYLVNILMACTLLANNLNVFMQALGWIKQAALAGMLQAAVNALIIGIGYYFNLIDIRFVLINLIIIQTIVLLALLLVFYKAGFIWHTTYSFGLSWKMLKAGLKQHTATVSTFVYTKINQLILFKYCGDYETGLFAVALNLAFSVMIIPMTFQAVLYPRVIHAQDDYEVTVRSLRLGFYLWGLIVGIIVIAAEPILMLYGGVKYTESIKLFRILMLAVWFLPLSSLLGPYYVKAGAFGMASLSAVILGGISIALNLYLIPRHLSAGAALATSGTCLFGFTLILLFLWYLSKKNPLVIFLPDFHQELRSLNLFGGKVG